MIYLKTFNFPDADREHDFFMSIKRKCYNDFYPFQVMTRCGLERLDFEPVTILYGGNGCGKTTALNIIAETLELERDCLYNRSSFFEDYTEACTYLLEGDMEFAANHNAVHTGRIPAGSRIITSDDVFDYMINLRHLNQGIDAKREELFQEYLDAKYSKFKMESLEDYEMLKKVNSARRNTQSMYTKKNLMRNQREQSNGESAFRYFTEKMGEDGLYLLDEPENSLSPARQQEMATFIADGARFFGCQFVISTHSPFLLAIEGAKVYDLDSRPAQVSKWTELENVKMYFEFFERHRMALKK